jgi:bifunctional DNase/RNase
VEGVFYAKLVAERDGLTEEIDARTSDAIALALRFECPISTFDSILSSYGILLEDEPGRLEPAAAEVSEAPAATEFSRFSLDDLQRMLDEALQEEDYEKASKLRDEMNKREGN